MRGDFPAFYAAGVIAAGPHPEMLYDVELQRAIENDAWPNLDGEVLVNAYPPYVAALAIPLTWLSPINSKIFHLLLSCAALIAAAAIIATRKGDKIIPVLAVLTCFAPILHGTLGGQNTAFSILCLCGAYHALAVGDKRSDMKAGLWLGLWLFKPNLALIVIASLVLSGRLYILPGVFLVALLYELLAVSLLGFWWLTPWLHAASQFHAADLIFNAHQMISIGGAAAALGAKQLLFPSIESGLLVGTVAGAILIFPVLYKVRRATCFAHYWLLVPAALLCSPHAVYYDVGLCTAAMLYLGMIRPELFSRASALLLLFGILCVGLKDYFPAQPLILLPVLLLVTIWRENGKSE
ncbi:MAG: DUF2029 domain-containing protein [Bdellovibrionales bacterium]|nr:DUF2029 domain-containing protein [Bdellovibrionales bacterium]